MKQLIRRSIHKDGRSYDCYIGKIKGKTIKMTYEAFNAVESCDIMIFSGNQWNYFLSMLDMGITPNISTYQMSVADRRDRADLLFKTAEYVSNMILSWI